MENLKKLRLERNLSQQKLAELVGTSQQSINKYENDISQPDLHMLQILAAFFHTSIDYISGYTDNPNPVPTLEELKIYEETLTPYRRNKLKKARDKMLSGTLHDTSVLRETPAANQEDFYITTSKERYHLSMYRELSPQMQDSLDLFLEGIVPDTDYVAYKEKRKNSQK